MVVIEDTSILLDGRAFLEGPRWRGDALYISDLRGGEVLRVKEDGSYAVAASVESPIGLGFLPDGRLLINSAYASQIVRLEGDGTLVAHGDFSLLDPSLINDMVTDGNGGAYISLGVAILHHKTLPADTPRSPTSVLYVDPDGTVSEAGGQLQLGNGILITPDGRTLIVADTDAAQLVAFDVVAQGVVQSQRIWAGLGEGTRPDGICLDQENGVWVGCLTQERFIRVIEGGEVTDAVVVPGRSAVACALGGKDGRTLFMATTDASMSHAEAAAARGSKIQTARVNVAGCERP